MPIRMRYWLMKQNLSRGDDPLYSALQLRLFQTGLDPDLAPNTNWRDVILRDRVWQNQHYFSVSGGGTNRTGVFYVAQKYAE